MAYQYQYDEDEAEGGRYRRNPPREEGFFDRVRDWFRGRGNDYDPERGGPDRRDFQQDRPRDPYRSGYNRDYERDYRYQRNDRPYDSEWDRARDTRRDWPRQRRDMRGDWNRENDPRQGRLRGAYDYPYGNRYVDRQDYQRDEDRYGSGTSRDYGRDYGRYYRRGYNRDYGADYGEDLRRRGAVPGAGMGADYGGDFDYSNRYAADEDINYGTGDVGYESEGAFYQDLDEPENYQSQVYRYGTGRSPYLGVGPLGYQRSDERISDDVCERLTRHGRVDASQIQFNVKDGEVTLQGKVPYREMKRLAEDVVERVSGVKDVHNEIKVEPRRAQAWDSDTEAQQQQRREANWEIQETRPQNDLHDWENRTKTSLEGLKASGETETGAASLEGLEASGETEAGAASLEELSATTQPTRMPRDIRSGMEVIGPDGRRIGKVKEVRQDDILVDREMARDIFVPHSAVSMVGELVMLTVAADAVDTQGWEKPELF